MYVLYRVQSLPYYPLFGWFSMDENVYCELRQLYEFHFYLSALFAVAVVDVKLIFLV